jgi:hypothetical protein
MVSFGGAVSGPIEVIKTYVLARLGSHCVPGNDREHQLLQTTHQAFLTILCQRRQIASNCVIWPRLVVNRTLDASCKTCPSDRTSERVWSACAYAGESIDLAR